VFSETDDQPRRTPHYLRTSRRIRAPEVPKERHLVSVSVLADAASLRVPTARLSIGTRDVPWGCVALQYAIPPIVCVVEQIIPY
jgi:hypothetical protein